MYTIGAAIVIGGALVWKNHYIENEQALAELQYQQRLNYISCLQKGLNKVEVENSTALQSYSEIRQSLKNTNHPIDKGKVQKLLMIAKMHKLEMQEAKNECETEFGKHGHAYNTALQLKLDRSLPMLPL